MTQRLVILIADLGVDERHRQPGERLGQAFSMPWRSLRPFVIDELKGVAVPCDPGHCPTRSHGQTCVTRECGPRSGGQLELGTKHFGQLQRGERSLMCRAIHDPAHGVRRVAGASVPVDSLDSDVRGSKVIRLGSLAVLPALEPILEIRSTDADLAVRELDATRSCPGRPSTRRTSIALPRARRMPQQSSGTSAWLEWALCSRRFVCLSRQGLTGAGAPRSRASTLWTTGDAGRLWTDAGNSRVAFCVELTGVLPARRHLGRGHSVWVGGCLRCVRQLAESAHFGRREVAEHGDSTDR